MFITIEGIDGVGKSTQVKRLNDYFTALNKHFPDDNRPILVTSEPSQNSETEKNLYNILKNESPTPTTDLLLCMVLRNLHINNIVKPALADNKIVICDRYVDSSIAYYVRDIKDYEKLSDIVLDLHKSVTDNLMPNLTILLDMPAENTINRMVGRGELDKFDSMKVENMEAIRQVFLYNAKDGVGKKRTRIIDATLPADEIFAHITSIITGIIKFQPYKRDGYAPDTTMR